MKKDISETKEYKEGWNNAFDIGNKLQESISDVFLRGYKMGFRDASKGHKRIPHKTMDGWCCACDYDLIELERRVKEKKSL